MSQPTRRGGLEILHRDRWLIVVDKPAGLPSVPSEGVSGRTCLSEMRKLHDDVIAVHRLDRETSGAMLFARSPEVEQALIEQFRAQRVRKKYLALVRGHPREKRGEIDKPIADLGDHATVGRGGEEALTLWRIVRAVGPATLIEAEPKTGRYNQIRLHLMSIGYPLVGERKYARGRGDVARFKRVALHAWKIGIDHPGTGDKLNIVCPVAADLEELMERIG